MSGKKKLRVLIADDENHIRMLVMTVMKSMGAEIVGEAKNGLEAMELYRKEKPNMVLMDINMPVKSGIDALKEIIAEFPDAVVVMLTSVADMKTVKECVELGASNYIRKDTLIPEIKKLVRETWGSSKGGNDG